MTIPCSEMIDIIHDIVKHNRRMKAREVAEIECISIALALNVLTD